MNEIIWVGFSLSVFASSILLAKKNRTASDNILISWLIILAIDFMLRGIQIETFHQALLTNCFLLFNPLLYLYTKSLTKKTFRLRYVQLLHLLPFLFFEPMVYIYAENLTLENFINHELDNFFFYSVIFISILSWLVYGILCLNLLIKHDQNLEEEYSTKSKNMKIGWLKFICSFYLLYILAVAITGAMYILKSKDSTFLVYLISSASLFLVACFSYFGILQDRIFPKDVDQKKSTNKQTFNPTDINSNKKKIFLYFEKDKPYLDSDFHMEKFSSEMELPKHQLTWILNQEIGKNFFRFVNSYRIEYAKKQLLDKTNKYSIEAIGYESGFNSKSSFFTIFKKETGLTPQQYRAKNTKT